MQQARVHALEAIREQELEVEERLVERLGEDGEAGLGGDPHQDRAPVELTEDELNREAHDGGR